MQAFTFVNTGASGTFDFDVAGFLDYPGLTLRDAYIVVYEGASIPTDVRMCLAANDNYFIRNNAQLFDVPIAAGATVTVVATSYDAASGIGTWRLDVWRN